MGKVFMTGGGGGTGPSSSDLTATAAHVLSGYTYVGADTNDARGTGTMPSLGAQTIMPSTVDQTLAAGRYLAGAQTIKGDAGLLAQNIKKGVTIFGITGTWEGYVGSEDDLYYAGDNGVINTTGARELSYQGTARGLWFERERIRASFYVNTDDNVPASSCHFATTQAVDLSSYNRLVITGTGFKTPLTTNWIKALFYVNGSDSGYGNLYYDTTVNDAKIPANQDEVVISAEPLSLSSTQIVFAINSAATKYLRIALGIDVVNYSADMTITEIQLAYV